MVLYDANAISQGFEPNAKRRLSERNLEDLDEIVRIRVSAKQRLYALRESDHVFSLLWWDPDHEIYPTKPKRT